jgi:hypothetical protein
MAKGISNPRINSNVWGKIKWNATLEKNSPYNIGQELLVLASEDGKDWIPCIPKPLKDNPRQGLVRIPNHTMITFMGMIEIAEDVQVMQFLWEDDWVLIGLGAAPYLKNIPKKKAPAKRRRGGGRKSPSRIAKVQRKNRKSKS